ncbi:hypothetical protein [Neorhizobium alkalisoli]|uniref:Uncharacterized protein n=1 Tax=Neorhizobium alkalisoli TaxID=528178 RepID=A0A561QGK1_9HYPH|nr:hypothetical protein [Neorhizobium alkalisoli]TWF49495.1 hypothetical protein FHW37_108165 [Neorhizobium alkalisoli]
MGDLGEFEICEPEPFIYFENGQLAITDGSTVYQVIVTCEAMRATAPPPEKSLRRLIRYAGYYRDLAAAAIRRGEAVDEKVWVTEALVQSSPPAQLAAFGGNRSGRRMMAPAAKDAGHAQHRA